MEIKCQHPELMINKGGLELLKEVPADWKMEDQFPLIFMVIDAKRWGSPITSSSHFSS